MTLEKEIFIRENYKNMTRQELADKLGLKRSVVDHFMCKHKLRIKKKTNSVNIAIKNNHAAITFIKENYGRMSYQDMATATGYAEATVRNYVAMYLTKEDALTGDLKKYYNYIKNIFDSNKVAAGRVNTSFKELMALARLKKEGLIQLQREDKGRYTVILN